MMRKILFQVHLWTGLVLGLVFAALGLSGSLLVYDHDILSFGERPVPHAAAIGAPKSLDALLAAARDAVGDKRSAATIERALNPGEAAVVRFQRGGGGPQPATAVYLDPVSGAVLDVRRSAPNAVFGFVHQLHGNLFLGRDGRSVVGWFGIGMVVLGISGIVLWWPKRGAWKNAFGVRKAARGYWFHRELHGAVGIWCWIVFVVVSISGTVIAFPDTARSVAGLPVSVAFDPRRGPAIEPVKGARPIGADGAVALVTAQWPGSAVRSVTVPGKRGEAIRVMVGRSDEGPVATAFVDPWRKTIVASRNAPGNAGERVLAWQRPLHAGNGLGPLWRALVFVSGLLPALFFATGLVMWVKKRKMRRATP